MTTETVPLSVDQLSHDLKNAQTALAFITHERDQLKAELDHYVAAATTADTEGQPLAFAILQRLRATEFELARWQREATTQQGVVLRQAETIVELQQGCGWLAETLQTLEVDFDLLAEAYAYERRQNEEL